eukprot:SM000232S07951  [mRNA]  locus=s232:200293:205781:- [translate_table: standard]
MVAAGGAPHELPVLVLARPGAWLLAIALNAVVLLVLGDVLLQARPLVPRWDNSAGSSRRSQGATAAGGGAAVATGLPSESLEAFLQRQRKDSDVAPLPDVSGAWVLQQPSGGRSCVLLLQDVCYVFLVGTGPHHSQYTGVWYAANAAGLSGAEASAARSLADIDLSASVCGGGGAGGGDRDLAVLQERASATIGSFVGQAGLAAYVNSSSSTSQKLLRQARRSRLEPINLAIVSRFDSHIGHFGEGAVPFFEAALRLQPPPVPRAGAGAAAAVSLLPLLGSAAFFPSDKSVLDCFPRTQEVRCNWTASLVRLVLGPGATLIAGRQEGEPVCFHKVAFILSQRHTDESADALRRLAAEEVVRQRNLAPRAKAGEGRKWANISDPLDWQITVEDRKNQRTVVNGWQLLTVLREVFQHLPVRVVTMGDMNFVQQVATMQRTVLYVSMHGASLSNAIFMPRGSTVLELFPYRFSSTEYKRISERSGLAYYSWSNTQRSKASYVDDCWDRNLVGVISNAQCLRSRECLFCIRDRSITEVDAAEFKDTIVNVVEVVEEFLAGSRSWRWLWSARV